MVVSKVVLMWLIAALNYAKVIAINQYFYEIRNFSVSLDHFNYVDTRTFKIRYLYNDSYINPSGDTPLFFYTGNEGDIELFAQNSGFVWEMGEQFKALVVFAEHRYYGKSLPFGDSTFNTSENIGFLSVEQTLEDYASLIKYLNEDNLTPVVSFGGSYGGMLAAWLRMKYPHLVIGALAASAPIWQFNGLAPCDIFFKITTSVFATSYSPNCTANIKRSWDLFKKRASTELGRTEINDLFKLCDAITQTKDIDEFLDYLEDVYGNLAMANYPYSTEFIAPLPAYPVRQFCFHLRNLSEDENFLQAMHKAISVYTNYTGNSKCLDYKTADGPSVGGTPWEIQTCNEMVMPMCSSSHNTMFRNKPWNYTNYSEKCFSSFKIRPKLDDIKLRYGGKNLKYVSSIIFSNGLLDPWSGGGVLHTSNVAITVIIIPEGAHHVDLRQANPSDPLSVQEARKREADVIRQWITDFFKIKPS